MKRCKKYVVYLLIFFMICGDYPCFVGQTTEHVAAIGNEGIGGDQNHSDGDITDENSDKNASGDASGNASADASGNASADAQKNIYNGPIAPKPQLLFRSAISLFLNKENAAVEYGIKQHNSQDDYKWQDNQRFFGLQPATDYDLAIRYKETDTINAGGMRELYTSTASWSYSLRYHMSNGENSSNNVLAIHKGQQDVGLVTPKRKGYQFEGWYFDSAYKKPVTKLVVLQSLNNTHLYAKWKKVNQNAVTKVKLSIKEKNRIHITFTGKATASYYQIQYSASSKFKSSETITKLSTGCSYTTPKLVYGTKYYVRIRSVSTDSRLNTLYGKYSKTFSKNTKADSKVVAGSKKTTSSSKKSKIKKKVVKVKTYNKGTVYLQPGEKKTLVIPAKSSLAKSTSVWAKTRVNSSKNSVAKITTKGKVTAKKNGRTKITIKRGYKIFKYTVVVEKLNVSISESTLVEGQTTKVAVTGNTSKVTYKTGDKKIATVSADGIVTALKAGKCDIYVNYHAHQYKVSLTVITLEKKKIDQTNAFYFQCVYKNMIPGQSFTIPFYVEPVVLTAADVMWYSSKPVVASVQDGVVTAKTPGTTEITVKYKDGKSSKMRIQVSNSSLLADHVKLISHRGGDGAPENTMVAFKNAVSKEYQYLETDIRWTKDNVPVLLHDGTIGRTSDALKQQEQSASADAANATNSEGSENKEESIERNPNEDDKANATDNTSQNASGDATHYNAGNTVNNSTENNAADNTSEDPAKDTTENGEENTTEKTENNTNDSSDTDSEDISDDATDVTLKPVSGDASISDLTYEQCLAYDWGSYYSSEFVKTPIVRLDELFEYLKEKNVKCYLELKGAMYREQCMTIAELVKEYQLQDSVTFISFSDNSLQSISELLPGVRIGYLLKSASSSYITKAKQLRNINKNIFLDVSGISQVLSLADLKRIGDNNFDFECYTINDMERMQQLVDQGAQGITTDSITISDLRRKGE